MILVSVIIPVYNAESTIEATIQSVLNQNIDNNEIEIILINDGSTDNSLNIIKKFESRCKIISTTNKGVSHARNLGFEISKGKYIQYLDSDDLLVEGKIKMQIAALENAQAHVAYGDWLKFEWEKGKKIIIENIVRSIVGRKEISIYRDFWCPPAAILYSRQVCNLIGTWNVNLPIIQDARYFLDAALTNANFIYTPGIVAEYRVHQSGSLSTQNTEQFISDCFLNTKEIYEKWKDDFDIERKSAIIDSLRFCINSFSKLNYSKFMEALNLLLIIQPNYIPEKSKSMNLLSRLFGYRNAEKIAYLKRRLS